MPGTTPVYGFPYPEPTDLVADYPALGQQLAEDIEDVLPTIGGLAPATPTSIANSGGTATLSGNTVTFSGVSSVSLNNCFSGDYDNYRMQLVLEPSTTAGVLMRLRASGTDNTGSIYQTLAYYVSDTGNGVYRVTSGSGFDFGQGSSTYDNTISADVQNPARAEHTGVAHTMVGSNGSAYHSYFGGMRHQANTAYDGLTIYLSSGTMTGTVSVYGYKK